MKNAGKKKKAEILGLGEKASFLACERAGDADAVRSMLTDDVFAASPDAPVMFYLRFFLHSIPEEVQDTLLGVIGSARGRGDMFAAEFRTTKDEAIKEGPRQPLPPVPGRARVRRRTTGARMVLIRSSKSRARASRPMGTRIPCSIAWSLAGGD